MTNVIKLSPLSSTEKPLYKTLWSITHLSLFSQKMAWMEGCLWLQEEFRQWISQELIIIIRSLVNNWMTLTVWQSNLTVLKCVKTYLGIQIQLELVHSMNLFTIISSNSHLTYLKTTTFLHKNVQTIRNFTIKFTIKRLTCWRNSFKSHLKFKLMKNQIKACK